MTKQELRKLYIQKRSLLTIDDLEKLNHQLSDNFFNNIDLSGIKVLHVFLPILKHKEPDTWLIINRIQENFNHIKLILPRIKGTNGELEHVLFENRNQLIQNNWGIEEPADGILSVPQDFDMVIVPLLAFDKHGNRVGYGKGFYDAFLSHCKNDCRKIGLSFFPPEENIDDIENHDEPLDKVITPTEVFVF